MDKYKVMSWGPAVGIGVTASTHLHLAAVGKTSSAANPYYIVNEIVAAEIGRRVRLPVPPSCAVVDDDGKPFFASLNFNLTGDSLPPIIPQKFRATFGMACAEIVAFDIYICNSDRHTANLAADYSDPARFNLFDHSHALMGYGSAGISRLHAAENALIIDGAHPPGNRHCLMDQITDDREFTEVLNRLESLEAYFISDLVQEVSEYGLSDSDVIEFQKFLLDRRGRVRELIATNKNSFNGIQHWSLI